MASCGTAELGKPAAPSCDWCQWIPLYSSPLNDQRHKDDVVPIVTKEGSTAEEAQFGGPALNSDRLVSMTEPPIGVDIAAELTAPPPDAGPQPAAVAPSPEVD